MSFIPDVLSAGFRLILALFIGKFGHGQTEDIPLEQLDLQWLNCHNYVFRILLIRAH